ncbi:hypothetical protein CUMW_217760 [Citrus unshiu]|nr:hypothetical protein CUMW_217760 [Citrus unshiu]
MPWSKLKSIVGGCLKKKKQKHHLGEAVVDLGMLIKRAGGLVSSSILWAHKITRQEHFPGQQLLFTNPLPESHNQEDKNFLFHKLSAEATLQRNCWCDNTNALLMFKE